MRLRVLITNLDLWPPTGMVVYVRDLALELQRQGHVPTVFSSTEGAIAQELRNAGIAVIDKLSGLEWPPDIIHGNHYAPTMVALRHWRTVPAIHVCHAHASPHGRTPIHPRVRRHFGVSRICVKRVVNEGVPQGQVGLLLNFVDTVRFSPRSSLPERPRRALLFSNYAHDGTQLPAVADACRQAGLQLDVAGYGVGRIVSKPERELQQYDIVFAKGKAAIEAMAVGNAVILCDYGGVGPMVTTSEFEELRPLNFGFEALHERLDAKPLLREIERYDPADAGRVSDLLRSCAGLSAAVENLVAIYQEVMADHRREVRSADGQRAEQRPMRELLFLRLYWAWTSLPRQRRERVKRLPGVRRIRLALRRLGYYYGPFSFGGVRQGSVSAVVGRRRSGGRQQAA